MHGIKTRLKIFLSIFIAIMVFGTIGFMAIEGRSPIDAVYFVIVTMATVGYGDVHPVTEWGKVFAMVLIVLGVGTFLGVVANLTEIVLAKREIESRMEKLNMVIGVFFSEVGSVLLSELSRYAPDFDKLRPALIVTAQWTDKDFQRARKSVPGHDYRVDMSIANALHLKAFLMEKRDFLVRLLENPVLMEHQAFTDLLRAVFHVTEELAFRQSFDDMPRADREHLAVDLKRVYHFLVDEWISYMKYLKNNYPFLFSLAVRTNPFDPTASVVLEEE